MNEKNVTRTSFYESMHKKWCLVKPVGMQLMPAMAWVCPPCDVVEGMTSGNWDELAEKSNLGSQITVQPFTSTYIYDK